MTLKEKIAILEAMDKDLPIQYSETDGEENDWEDLKIYELNFNLYTYRVKPKSNSKAKFKTGYKLVNIADEGKLNPPIVTVKGFSSTGEYLWEEVYHRTPVEAIDANYMCINDVYWFHSVHYKHTDRYSLTPTMLRLHEIRETDDEAYTPIFEMGFRIPR